jgi:hypothetical protein
MRINPLIAAVGATALICAIAPPARAETFRVGRLLCASTPRVGLVQHRHSGSRDIPILLLRVWSDVGVAGSHDPVFLVSQGPLFEEVALWA